MNKRSQERKLIEIELQRKLVEIEAQRQLLDAELAQKALKGTKKPKKKGDKK